MIEAVSPTDLGLSEQVILLQSKRARKVFSTLDLETRAAIYRQIFGEAVCYHITGDGLNLAFDGDNYYNDKTAFSRCHNLVKDFPGIQLKKIDSNGKVTILYPTKEIEAMRRKERARNKPDYSQRQSTYR